MFQNLPGACTDFFCHNFLFPLQNTEGVHIKEKTHYSKKNSQVQHKSIWCRRALAMQQKNGQLAVQAGSGKEDTLSHKKTATTNTNDW